MEQPVRKRNRLPAFDYGSPGYYFITICTKGKECLFWEHNGLTGNQPLLSSVGRIVRECIMDIPRHYPAIRVDQFNVMPNHVHLILEITELTHADIPTIIGQLKRAASKSAGFPIWQRSYHDHVIRGDDDYQKIWEYVAYNHLKWQTDCFYIPPEPND